MGSAKAGTERAWRRVREQPADGPPALVHPGWREAFPWLMQGTTYRGAAEPDGGFGAPFDLGLFSDASPALAVATRWEALRAATGMARAVLGHQVHGACVRLAGPGAPGLHVTEPCDGHVTREAGVLLAVTVADCVPLSIVEPELRAVAMLHAGWRGVAAGILESGLGLLADRLAVRPDRLHVHLGPAICGDCYEVGPEVPEALGEPSGSAGRTTVDLRAALARRAEAAGVRPDRITLSEHCTRCGEGPLFSHRGGDRERQVGYLGIRR